MDLLKALRAPAWSRLARARKLAASFGGSSLD
jgi:hypothetical protein